jgi:hypothetical protein
MWVLDPASLVRRSELRPSPRRGSCRMSAQRHLQVDAEHFRRRVLQDALQEALGSHWRRRASTLLRCVSRPDDFLGRSTPEQRAERDSRLRADAERCLIHAGVIERGPDMHAEDVINALREVA